MLSQTWIMAKSSRGWCIQVWGSDAGCGAGSAEPALVPVAACPAGFGQPPRALLDDDDDGDDDDHEHKIASKDFFR